MRGRNYFLIDCLLSNQFDASQTEEFEEVINYFKLYTKFLADYLRKF